MNQIKTGFIGAGNMASAIINGILSNGILEPSEIAVTDIDSAKVEKLSQKGVVGMPHASEVVRQAKYIFLAVKPQHIESVLEGICGDVRDENVFISIAAGISGGFIKEKLQKDVRLVLAMPNTPLLLGCGATAVCRIDPTGEDEFRFVQDIFSSAGMAKVISSDKMNEIIPVNGSSPAFIYQFTKCFVEEAVQNGIDRSSALELFCQSLIGSAKMMTESGYDLDELIKMVSSPGGTTIAGLKALREHGFEDAVCAASRDCIKRAYELGK
ncbi:pyrroline-5-carboxylate reductase [Candidatus Soleaferrea massiliensis]|uniref:pyrroline-5-carboxylate reductase n=1 Tax=Candidatus Soleaferrea massiliensis TaxID=1470354 RepID=UPI000A7F4027|nr:pyrroline-5-carboxylate reductase [Candidatus Soleaferrea massiliensis]